MNQKLLLWFQKKRLMTQFCCCCNFARAGHIGMQIFNFIVSSAIIAHHSVLSLHISKAHFPISSLNVRELKLNWCLQDQSRKIGGLSAWGMEAQLLLQNLKIYLMNLPLFIEVYIFKMRFNLNKIFFFFPWAEMSLNKLKCT